MVRLFHVYYPVRTLVLLAGELAVLFVSFLVAVGIGFGADATLILRYEFGFVKIASICLLSILLAHYLDLYSPQDLTSDAETYVRLYAALGILSIGLAGLSVLFPSFAIGRNVYFYGLLLYSLLVTGWRKVFNLMLSKSMMRERVYVLGDGGRARRLVSTLRSRVDVGMEVVGWSGALGGNGSLSRDQLADSLISVQSRHLVDRVIVALENRRGTIPVNELLQVRLAGIKVEDATSLLEKTSGSIELEYLHPSWLIFSDGFRLSSTALLLRRMLSFVMSLLLLLCLLPLLPIIVLLIKLDSPGPIFYRQRRVGMNGKQFDCLKFRTMRQDAEAGSGAVWAKPDDPRITRIGTFLRKMRLDEIPQLWSVLCGHMAFVGPRPERPEFVEWLAREIPYYQLRHVIRPGVTGWAQVRYSYGSSIEDAKQKLMFDLYYIKHMSLSLDLLIAFETVKTVLRRRGAH